jgi:C1A family cysteine protease
MTDHLTELRHRLGGRHDREDPRDRWFEPAATRLRALAGSLAPAPAAVATPASVDLRPQCPPVYDQGRIASCTANAIAAAIAFSRARHGQVASFDPSRLFIYYNERALRGDEALDSGASTRDGIKTVAKQGVAPETLWPYDDTPASHPGGPFPPDAPAGQKPPEAAYRLAALFEVLDYRRVRRELEHMKACLVEGYPFTITLTVYPSFMSAPRQQAVVTPLPGADEQPLGQHVVLVVGYQDDDSRFVCRNSWGSGQGEGGYFYLPYDYAVGKDLATDLWTLRTIEN